MNKPRATTAGVPRSRAKRPVCEECDQEMHEFDGDGYSGWSCDGCGWSFDNEDKDDTSTEAHMSKVEVKVMKGDRWEVWGGLLYLVRGDRNLVIRNQNDMKSPFFTVYNKSTTTAPKVVDTAFASVIIESLGGTVVEEREEEKAVRVVAHMDLTPSEDYGDVQLSIDGSETCKYRDGEPHIYRRITISGVTA